MKNIFLSMIITAMITGCSAQAENEAAKEAAENNEVQVNDEASSYVPNPQLTDDRTLQEVGQSHMDAKGASTLKAIKKVNKTYQVGDVQVTIHDIKVIDHTPDHSMIDFFHSLTHDEEFDFIKVNVEITNTSNETVYFSPLALLETSEGEEMHLEQDIYLESLNGELPPNGHKAGNMGFILEHPLTEDLDWVKITTSDVLNEKHEIVNKAQDITIEF